MNVINRCSVQFNVCQERRKELRETVEIEVEVEVEVIGCTCTCTSTCIIGCL